MCTLCNLFVLQILTCEIRNLTVTSTGLHAPEPTHYMETGQTIDSVVLRHRPARPGPRAPAEQGAPLSQKYIFLIWYKTAKNL